MDNPTSYQPTKRGPTYRFSPLTPAQLDAWSKTRLQGKACYILRWGVCLVGGTAFLARELIHASWNLLAHQPVLDQRVSHYVGSVGFSLVLGYVSGALLWSSHEGPFRKVHGLNAPKSTPQGSATPLTKFDY